MRRALPFALVLLVGVAIGWIFSDSRRNPASDATAPHSINIRMTQPDGTRTFNYTLAVKAVDDVVIEDDRAGFPVCEIALVYPRHRTVLRTQPASPAP